MGHEEKIRNFGIVGQKFPFRVVIDRGFHSFKTSEHANFYIKCTSDPSRLAPIRLKIIVECKIPAGARYYENKNEYVSDRIIPIKKFK
jgi:hypothetical protein